MASKVQKLNESSLFLDQRTTCALVESGGLGGKLSCIIHSGVLTFSIESRYLRMQETRTSVMHYRVLCCFWIEGMEQKTCI